MDLEWIFYLYLTVFFIQLIRTNKGLGLFWNFFISSSKETEQRKKKVFNKERKKTVPEKEKMCSNIEKRGALILCGVDLSVPLPARRRSPK